MATETTRKIALYGRSGSGKSSISQYLAERHGFLCCSSGELCRTMAIMLFGNDDRKNLNVLSQKVREIDLHLWLEAALRVARTNRIVFESVRYVEDVSFLESHGFEIWHIDCPNDVCQRRLHERGQQFDLSDLDHHMESALDGFPFSVRIDNGERSADAVRRDIDKALQS